MNKSGIFIIFIIIIIITILLAVLLVYIFKKKSSKNSNEYPEDSGESSYSKNEIKESLPSEINLNVDSSTPNSYIIDILRYIGLNERYGINKLYIPSNVMKEDIYLDNNKNFSIGKILTNNDKIFIFIDDYDFNTIDNTFTMTNVNNKFNIITKFYEDYQQSNIKKMDFANKNIYVYARGYSIAFIYMIYYQKQYNSNSIFVLEGFPSIISGMEEDFYDNNNVYSFNILKDPLITYVHRTEIDNQNNIVFFDYLNSETAYGENFDSKYDNHHILTYQKLFKLAL